MRASGTFEVTIARQAPDEYADGAILDRRTIDKRFAGELVGESKGQMLASMSAVQGSAGYVAMERVTATIGERHGTFVLQHNATMSRGTPAQNIVVVPDSGTGDFVGISGICTIRIEQKVHYYDFDYTLPE